MSKSKIIKLKNGLKIWYLPNPNSNLLNVGFWTLGGMAMETPRTLEYYHFLEHMVADFTSLKYPNGRENNRELKILGVNLQGEVCENTMHVWMEGHKRAATKMIDMLVNTLLDFRVDPTRFNQEKESIVTELKGYQNDPFHTMEEYQMKQLHPTHIMATTLSDRVKSTLNATADELQQFFKDNITTHRTIVCINGNLPNATPRLKQLSTKLSLLAAKTSPLPTVEYKFNPLINPTLKTIHIPDAETYRIQFAWPLPHLIYFNKQREHFEIIENIIKIRLFELLRIKLGLIYSINFESHYNILDPQLSAFVLETDVGQLDNIAPTVDATLLFMDNFKTNVTNIDLFQTKRELSNIYENTKLNQTLDAQYDNAIEYLLTHRSLVNAKKRHSQLQKLTLADITKTADTHLTSDQCYIFIAGKLGKKLK